jgi:adenylate kinase
MKSLIRNKTILMLGAPGSGKGSYSNKISKRFNIPVYSIGEHLRKIISNPTDSVNVRLMKEIAEEYKLSNVHEHLNGYISKGQLIPKELLRSILEFTLNELKNTESNSVILDGYPRTLPQAVEFETKFNRKIDLVININQDNDIITKKLLGRRQCSKCQASYNVADIDEKGYKMPSVKPKVDGVCDKCGGNLVMREDDTLEIIQNRLQTYDSHNNSMLTYFKEKGILRSEEMRRGFDDIDLLYSIVERELL